MGKKLFIIGGGPAGYVAAVYAAQEGLDVTLAEKDSFGGTCLNRGCIPTKALLYATNYREINYGRLGIEGAAITFNRDKLKAWKDSAVLRSVKGIDGLLKKNNVKTIRGEALLKGSKELVIGGESFQADNIILAHGSVPSLPSFIQGDAPVWTSDEALELPFIPKKLLIIGGGVIGVEMATIYRRLGAEVIIFDILPRIGGASLDIEVANELEKSLKGSGIEMHLSTAIVRIENGKLYTKDAVYEADAILVSTGRKANIPEDVTNAGIIKEAGRIKVDGNLMTNIPGIYAVGDMVEGPMLAHKASHDGLNAVNHILGKDRIHAIVPSVIYTYLEAASIGLTEEEAAKTGEKIIISRFPFSANPRSNCSNKLKGFVKIISSGGKIAGAHIIGEGAGELIWPFGYLISKKTRAGDILGNTMFPHPSYSEAVYEALLGLKGKMIHL